MNKQPPSRRVLLKRRALLSAGLLLLRPDPSQAIARKGPTDLAADQSEPPNDTLRTIVRLRTIHGNFLNKEIPDATVQQIVRASVRAANASNMQSYSIVVVRDRTKMKQVCTYQGSCMLLYCVDFTRLKASAESLRYSYFPDNIESFITASINTSLAVQTAVIAAKSLGIDSLITNGIHRGDMSRVWELLELPQTYCFPLVAVVLGYPATEPAYLKGRLDGPGVIHYEKYHRPTREELQEQISQYDDPKRHLALEEGWKAKGYKHFMDWWFKDWLGGSKPTERETQMLRFLRRSGFVEQQRA